MKRKPWRKALGTPEQRLAFRQAVLLADGYRCRMAGKSNCQGELQAAHVVSKEKLRRQGFGAETIYDPASAMTLCERHHNRHDRHLERVSYELLPQRCRDFLFGLGLTDVLRFTGDAA